MTITLKPNEQNKYITIKRYCNKEISRKIAADILDVSESWVSVLKNNYKISGKQAFKHKSSEKRSILRISNEIEDEIVKLYKTKYIRFNFRHFYEKVIDNNDLATVTKMNPPPCFKTVTRVLKRNNIKSPKCYKDKDKNTHPKRARRKYFGELIQMDGSVHDWFENGEKCTLHLAVDDSTSKIVGAYFEKEETTFAYFKLAKQIIEKYGIPKAFYTDNRSSFEYKSGKSNENRKIQFKRACNNLGINLITTSVPQAKGRVERANRTFQDRLVSEFRLRNITNIKDANNYLQEFVREYNSKFSIKNNNTCFSPCLIDIDNALCFRETRKVLKGNVFSYKSKQYKADKILLQEGKNVEILLTLGGVIKVEVDGIIYDTKFVADGSYTGQRMSPNHPWRYGGPGAIFY